MSTTATPGLRPATHPTVTDGGLETDLIFHAGVDLPEFAAFPLLDDERGRELLRFYYRGYAEVAVRAGVGLLLETPTWRANPDWGARLGRDAAGLARTNRAAVAFLSDLGGSYAGRVPAVTVSGVVGPRGDGYRADGGVDAGEAAAYHRPQLDAFAEAGADLATAYTLTTAGEAVGVVRAARAAGLPVAVSFTLETDGRLPDGTLLADAVEQVDADGGPDFFLLNCAHPRHVLRALDEPGGWQSRIRGLRCNASTASHAELDAAEQLDEGDLDVFADGHSALRARLPWLTVLGGCCGTDVRHVARIWGVDPPR
ncbi:Homocysteine/selenocysteine methylase (S-methylmethionine-dependent) [Friedmanniella luteola]|uniref:Homocysteine/selenocysteine methylase (S-methylmethionine-dependent) n=1 Tax=Friedmanniella luteola TaxID=546871 RepID=A0A1H1ZD11_9ACTN|nr:homocysteine S-methyltransferase family protein [Friedmanniella luteola]SDT31096.1 Homocysteine/selenocysteine methylase (S-methylmethionine-dependent) [Friedmanniella luteola]